MTSLPHKNHNDWSVHADDKVNDDIDVDDDDDDSSKSSNGLEVDGTVTTEEPDPSRGRDEVKEVRNMSSQDTRRLRRWRLVVTGVLLLTAFAVTFTTYTLLQQQEDENFQTAFEQFARTVGDAAVDQQKSMQGAFEGFAKHISSTARDVNATWPIFRIPYFELHAAQVRLQSAVEYLGIQYMIEPKDREEYLKFVDENYEDSMEEGHMIRYGNTDRLMPIGYTPNFTIPGLNGIEPDYLLDRPIRSISWQISPPLFTYHSINLDSFVIPFSLASGQAVYALKSETILTGIEPYSTGGRTAPEHDAMHSSRLNSDVNFPHSYVSTPIHEIPDDSDSKIVGHAGGLFAWDFALRNLLPDNVNGIMVELRNTCNQSGIYSLVGHDAFYLGENATIESSYVDMGMARDLTISTHPNFTTTPGHCQYTIHVFPSSTFHDSYKTNTPAIYAAVVALTFLLVAAVFFIYDVLVQRRNEKIVVTAARSNAIVSSIFPDAIRDRLLEQNAATSKQGHLKSYLLNGGGDDAGSHLSKPLADLFLETTVLFADISGFTAWSSVRDPTQVFILLETLYKAFDAIANRRRVYKVETVGDSYVAVTGLPEPQKDHAVIMSRFARDIMSKMYKVTRDLELSLGPGTADLKLRIGLHSGPVTGGVLRGERSRFQLFGDTVNTAARMESTGVSGCIHMSTVTADLLKQAGKHSWLKKRDECVIAKGKGPMQTFWLTGDRDSADDHTVGGDSTNGRSLSSGQDAIGFDELIVRTDHTGQVVTLSQQTSRLINWNVERLVDLVRQIVARRSASKAQSQAKLHDSPLVADYSGTSPIDEVQEIIALPEFDVTVNHQIVDAADIVIPPIVVEQLEAYVTWVASMYKSNPFHSFDHASHVVMSVIKLMSRIVAPTDQHMNDNAATLHDHTYGITSDPLTQFACVFSALIHDVDHTGVPNTTLVSEHADIAAKYKNRSVAEQNSLELAWSELMNETKYKELRTTLFTDEAELIRFRKLVVNGVMATDIADKDLKTLRNNRWDKAFKVDLNQTKSSKQEQRDAINRKATIVIEHLIQASDVSHTMQHWHVFRKWNQSLFEEMYEAYRTGRAETNPADFWYQGEIGFFDYYIIPLAKKLKDCGVFGVSSDEYLNYAMKNREEWEVRGQEVVMEMVEAVAENARKQKEKSKSFVKYGVTGSAVAAPSSDDSRYLEC